MGNTRLRLSLVLQVLHQLLAEYQLWHIHRAKIQGHYLRPLRLTAHLFQKPEPICMIFGTLKRCFVLNTKINFQLCKMVPPGEIQQPEFRFWRLYGNFSIKCWAEPVWTGCRILTAAERWEDGGHPPSVWAPANVVHIGELICSEAWLKVSQASGISEWFDRLKSILQQNGEHVIHIFEWKNDVCAVNLW